LSNHSVQSRKTPAITAGGPFSGDLRRILDSPQLIVVPRALGPDV
jgi:hypothetical protein